MECVSVPLVPAAWQGQDLPPLTATVRRYTRETVAAFASRGTPVDLVQVGNEVTGDTLFPLGDRLSNLRHHP